MRQSTLDIYGAARSPGIIPPFTGKAEPIDKSKSQAVEEIEWRQHELFRAIAAEDIGSAAVIAAQVRKSEEVKGHRVEELCSVTDDGRAVVHGDRERVKQLYQRSTSLESLGMREQARWATIDSFETIPLQLRVNADWLKSLTLLTFYLKPVARPATAAK